MKKVIALTAIVAAFSLCFALVGCGGDSSPTNEPESSAPTDTEASAPAEEPADAEPAENNHDSYFVGKWDLYESEEATHEQIAQVMEQYANDPSVREQMNEAYGRDNIEFCARFNADGTGEIDTGAALVSFTWEASNDGAVTFTSFDGDETALHLPVTDGKFTLNGDTYAKAE